MSIDRFIRIFFVFQLIVFSQDTCNITYQGIYEKISARSINYINQLQVYFIISDLPGFATKPVSICQYNISSGFIRQDISQTLINFYT